MGLEVICGPMFCGKEAVFHIKKKKSGVNPLKITSALIGGTKDYEARCRECFKKE